MALFKISKGLSKNLTAENVPLHEGYCYFTPDDGKFWIDAKNDSDVVERIPLNSVKSDFSLMAGEAERVSGTAVYSPVNRAAYADEAGNADTVNGHTVNANVPAGAVFTDTVYTHPATHPVSMITGAAKLNSDGKIDSSQFPASANLNYYNITDAKIENGKIILGANEITPLTASSKLDASKLTGTISRDRYVDNDTTYTLTQDTSNKHKITFHSSNANVGDTVITIPDNNTVTTVTSTGSGNAVTDITATGGHITATMGATFSQSGHKHTKADISDFGSYIPASQKGANGGVATLDSNGKINDSHYYSNATLGTYHISDAKIENGKIILGTKEITPLTSSSSLDASKLTGTISRDRYVDNDTKYTLTQGSDKHQLIFHSSDSGVSDTVLTIPDNNTVTTVTSSGSGNAVTELTASGGHITAKMGATFTDNGTFTQTVSKLEDALSKKADIGTGDKIPASQLPSFVDDVVEGYYNPENDKFYTVYNTSTGTFSEELTPERDKIYVDITSNLSYRYGGSQVGYVVISQSLALGETANTAYRGDRGKIAYDHSQKISGNPHNVTKSDVGLGNVENKSSSTIRGELTSSNVTTALGYTPYNSTNPNNYTSNTGTITGVKTSAGTHTAIDTSSGKATFNVPTTGAHIAMTGYAKASSASAVATSDTVNTAIGKLEKKIDDKTSNTGDITGSGTAGYLTKFDGPKSITNGPQLGTSTLTYLRNDGQWAAPSGKSFYCTCSTAAGTAAKIVNCADANFVQEAGVIIHVKFTTTNTAGSSSTPVTLNVNNKGAKGIWYNAGAYTGTSSLICGAASRIISYIFDGTYWVWLSGGYNNNTDTIPSAYCTTGAATAAKYASCSNYTLKSNSYAQVLITSTNTAQSALTLNINSQGAKPIYINGAISSASNYTLPAGTYFVYYDGANYYFRTDGLLHTNGVKVTNKASITYNSTANALEFIFN